MNITFWNRFSLTIQLPAHNCGSASLSEGTGNIWFLIWWSKEPKVKDKGCSSRMPQRHWRAEPEEAEQFMPLLYPWRPRGCRDLSPCCHHAATGDRKVKLSWQGGPCRGQCWLWGGHRSLWDGRATPWPAGNGPTLPTVQLLHLAAFSRLWQTTLHWPWMERPQLAVPGAKPRPPPAHGCFSPGDSQSLYWWHWDRSPAVSGVPLLGMCYMKMVLDWWQKRSMISDAIF